MVYQDNRLLLAQIRELAGAGYTPVKIAHSLAMPLTNIKILLDKLKPR